MEVILFNYCHRSGQSLSILCAYNNKGHGNNFIRQKKRVRILGKVLRDTLQSII